MCGKPHRTAGYCKTHYEQMRTTGSTRSIRGHCKKGEAPAFLRALVSGEIASAECIRWPFALSVQGYGVIKIGGSAGRLHLVHRIVCEAFHGPQPEALPQAAHRCGNRWCVNQSHLRWDSQSGNERDKDIHGTRQVGERHHWAKVDASIVRRIRALRGKLSQSQIGEKFGLRPSHVGLILRRKIWAHITD